MINIDYIEIARAVTVETGLGFSCRNGAKDGEQWIELKPIGYSKSNAFTIRATIGWRHVEVLFIPGSFSGELLKIMRNSSNESRNLFVSILNYSQEDGATVSLKIDNKSFDFKDDAFWGVEWLNLTFGFRVGQLNLSDDHEIDAQDIVRNWISRMTAAVISLMPMEGHEHDNEKYPEGASVTVQVNRYERDPRNRAAALSIHGYACKGCGLVMSDLYGDIATGFIEVHHIKPVSVMGDNYLIDPVKDLLPLCPNCHSIVHRRKPPYTLNELKEILAKERDK